MTALNEHGRPPRKRPTRLVSHPMNEPGKAATPDLQDHLRTHGLLAPPNRPWGHLAALQSGQRRRQAVGAGSKNGIRTGYENQHHKEDS